MIRIIHFNDAYKLEPFKTEPTAGFARFANSWNSHKDATLRLFSGDIFNPSLESTVTKGKHMVAPLNALSLDAACIGNHDLDFGFENCGKLVRQCSFPWLLANITDKGKNIASSVSYTVKQCVDSAGDPVCVGIIGLAEEEWLSTVPQLPPVSYHDFLTEGRSVARMLRKDKGCTLVIALTHMRLANDIRLADAVEEIDLILGGHDHFYQLYPEVRTCVCALRRWKGKQGEGDTQSGQIRVVKSGSDFRYYSNISIPTDAKERAKSGICVTKVTVASTISEDPEIVKLVEEAVGEQFRKMKKPIAKLMRSIDTRSEWVRLHESNIGDFACDVIRFAYETDVSFLCGGAIRSDAVYDGDFTIRDLLDIFPCMLLASYSPRT